MALNESLLKQSLIGLTEEVRALHIVSAKLLYEVATLREVVRGLAPTLPEVLTQRDVEAIDRTSQEAIRRVDEMILGLWGFLVQ